MISKISAEDARKESESVETGTILLDKVYFFIRKAISLGKFSYTVYVEDDTTLEDIDYVVQDLEYQGYKVRVVNKTIVPKTVSFTAHLVIGW